MAAENTLRFDDNFVDLPCVEDSSQTATSLITSPTNPLYDLIDSERYIQSLENKLKKLKGGKQKEPTAKEMIKSLGVSKEAHFRNLDNDRDRYCSNFAPASYDIDKTYSVLERKLHPDRVAVDPEELVELLHDNEVEKRAESDQVLLQPPVATCSSRVSNSLTNSIEKTTQSPILPTCTNEVESNTLIVTNKLETVGLSNVLASDERTVQTEEPHNMDDSGLSCSKAKPEINL